MDRIILKSRFNLATISLFIILTILPLLDGGFDNNLSMYLLLFALLVFVIKNKLDRKDTLFTYKSPLLWYSLYLVWCGLSFIWSIYYIRTMVELMELLLYGAVFLLTTSLDDEDNDKVISVVLLIGAGIALLGILEYIFISNRRIVSTFTNPNPFASYLLVHFLFSWGRGLGRKTRLGYLVSFIFLVALLLSGSRGGYISTLAGLGFLFLVSGKGQLKERFIKTLVLFILAIMMTRLIFYLAPIIQDKLGITPSMVDFLLRKDSLIGSSLTGRLEFWKVAGKLIKNEPLRGYGLGSFFSAYYIEYGGNQWYSRFVHNHYLQMMAETGIIGLSLFLTFLFANLRIIYRRIKSKTYPVYYPGLVAGLVGFLIHIGAEFSFNFPGATVIFFWLLGMGIRAYNSDGDVKKHFKLHPRVKSFILFILIILVLYNFTFFKLIGFASESAAEGKLDKALGLIEFSNTYYPISPLGYEVEGDYYYGLYKESKSLEDLDQAIRLYEKALSLAAYDGGIHNRLGELYKEAGDLKRAEEHLVLGAEYGAYNISRYLDLGIFYLNEDRPDEAERVFLKGASLKDYAIESAKAEDKNSVVLNGVALHAMLYNIYKSSGQEDKLAQQIDELNKMMEEYDFLRDYFKLEFFVD
ncbi:MAG: O-antigen ligase family protein [Tissierellaceae bacterium]